MLRLGRKTQAPPRLEGVCHHLLQQTLLRPVQSCGAKILGRALGVFDGFLDTLSAASHSNVPWMWPSRVWGFHSWDALCKGGWVFSTSDKRLHPKTPSMFIFGEETWLLWALVSPAPNLAGEQSLCSVWLSCGMHSSPSALFVSPQT